MTNLRLLSEVFKLEQSLGIDADYWLFSGDEVDTEWRVANNNLIIL